VKKGFTLLELPAVRKGFTLLELLVAIGIIALLVGLLLPAINRGRDHAKRVNCVNNLRQIYVAFNVYSDEYNGKLPPILGTDAPPGEHWMVRLENYGLKTRVVFCPTDPNLSPTSSPLDPDDSKSHSYVMNYFAELAIAAGATPSLWDVPNPAENVFMAEKKPTQTDFYLSVPAEDPLRVLDEIRHHGAANYLFTDGHVSTLPDGKSLSPHNLWTLNPSD
jgi:prepilin-type N-terminal cleavage/methylation domain-containing protein/prepilin-type processing-associated H-X9-DG protein